VNTASMLAVQSLHLTLGQQEVLRDVNFTLARGELVGLVGANGAGKSSLLRICALLQPADRGVVTWQGGSPTVLTPRQRARLLAYLPQHAPVHWPLAVAHVIALGRLPHGGAPGALSAADAAAVRDAAAAADIDDMLDRDVSTLSGGEVARVMLARLFAGGAPLLLADEPVAALDPQHQLRVMGLLHEHAARGGSCIVVLHDLALAARFCDRLLLLHDGALLAAGPPETVLVPSLLRTAFGIDAVLHDLDGIPQLRMTLPAASL